jgi:hypothetical protein
MASTDKTLQRLLPWRRREHGAFAEISEIYDAEGFVERGFATFEDKKVFEPVISETGFTDMLGGEFYRLKSYTPAPRSLLRIASADIYFPNIVVTNNTLLNVNNGYTSTERIRQRALISPLRQVDGGFIVDNESETVSTKSGCYLAADDNYSAWLLGEIPRIENYLRHSGVSSQVILHGDVRQFHLDSLAAYGISPDRVTVVAPRARISARDILFATPGYFHHIPSPDGVNFLTAITPDLRRTAPRKIYVSRSRTKMRRIRNEAELERSLQGEGYEIVFPEDLTFTQQAETFRNADIIVAPFGAALVNLVYVAPSCRVALITTKFTLEFARLLQMRSINFFVFNGLARNWTRYLAPRRIRERHTEYIVDIKRLTASLRRLEIGDTGSRGNGAIYRSHRQLRRR